MRAQARSRVLIAHADPLIAAGLAASLREHGFDVLGLDDEAALAHSNEGAVTGADVAVADYDSGLGLLRLTSRELDILRHVSLAGIGNGKPPSPSAPRHF